MHFAVSRWSPWCPGLRLRSCHSPFLHGVCRVCSHLLVLARLPTRAGGCSGLGVPTSPAACWEHPPPAPLLQVSGSGVCRRCWGRCPVVRGCRARWGPRAAEMVLGQPPSSPAAEGAGGPGMASRAGRRLDWAGLYWAGLGRSGSLVAGGRTLFTQTLP